MQAAQHLVQVDQAGGQARQAPVAREGLRGHIDRALDRLAERLEPARRCPGLGQRIELLLSVLDLVARRVVGVGHRLGSDIAADPDQLAPQGQVMDQPGIIGGVCGRRRAVHQVGQIAEPAQFLKGHVASEPLHQHDGLGQLALADVLFHSREQAGVEGFVEVVGLQSVAHAFVGGIVEQDRAQQGLLGLDVRGRVGRDRIAWPKVEGGS